MESPKGMIPICARETPAIKISPTQQANPRTKKPRSLFFNPKEKLMFGCYANIFN
jgi:hypothetical protein